MNFGGTPNPTPSSGVADANGHGSFEYNPTIGGVAYLALCTKNLAEQSDNMAYTTIDDPTAHF